MEKTSKSTNMFWIFLGIASVMALAAIIVIRHVYFYDEFAQMTLDQGLPAPPHFPTWQRIGLAGMASIGFLGAVGTLFRRSWGLYLFLTAFIIWQTFAFSIGQFGLPSLLTGLTGIMLGMNQLYRMK